jgi:hypothetical protein
VSLLSRLFRRPFKLELGERRVTFNTVSDFEFSLSSRTEVPAGRVAELLALSEEELRREADSLRQVEKRFLELLSRSIEAPGSVNASMAALDSKNFSQDHEWRAIIAGVNRQGPHFHEFKRIALVKYVQYLGSRQDIIRGIQQNHRPAPQANPESAMGETSVFEAGEIQQLSKPAQSYRRLPTGEAVNVLVPESGELQMLLSNHPFTYRSGDPGHLVDAAGCDYTLFRGPNRVGRNPENDVVTDVSFRDISRRHMIIEPVGANVVRITDVSAHGTSLPQTVHFKLADPA